MGVKDLKRRLGAMNSLEEEVGNMPECIGMGMGLLSRMPVVETLRPTVNKWNLTKRLTLSKKSKGCLGLIATNLLSG